MRLNPDCIRDVLLMVEEKSGFGKFVSFPNDSKYLKSYDADEVRYHIQQCGLSGLLIDVSCDMTCNFMIQDLSPIGHEFLANIRNDNNWNKTKQLAKKAGSESLSVLTQIAAQVISNLLSNSI